MPNKLITQHAVQRFMQRVDRTVSANQAAGRIAAMLEHGRVRPNPRRWTTSRPAPGTVFIYCADEPEACLVATGGAVVTVVSRDLCAASRPYREAPRRPTRGGRRPRLIPDRWNGTWLEAAL